MGISRKIKNHLRQAVFFDRDGVINNAIDRGNDFFVAGKKVRWTAPFNLGEFKLKVGTEEALKQIGELGFLRILVTNQPDIAYKTMTQAEHDRIMTKVKKLPFDDIFVCVHGRDDGCECKKPRPGMLLEAAEKWGIDLGTSFMIGDTACDMGAAKAVGCRMILIDGDYNKTLAADIRVSDLREAALVIKNHQI